MRTEALGGWELPHFDLASLRVEGYWLLGLYALFFLVILYLRRGDFRSLRGRKLVLFLAVLLLTALLNNGLWLRFPTTHVLPPPGIPTSPPAPSVPLLGALGVFIAGALWGAGPAMVMGLVAGLVRGGVDSSRVFAPPEMAAFGLIVGFLLHQAYRGREWRFLRQPAGAALIGSICHWMLLGMGVFAATSGSGLNAFDYTRSLLFASTGAVAMDGLLSGLLVQGLYFVAPWVKPSLSGFLTPPHQRSMNRRLLTALIPLTLLMIIAMFVAVTMTAIKEATNQAVNGMMRSANNASEMIPLLFNTGQELLQRFASDEQLRNPDPEIRQRVLEADLKVGVYGPFFSQLILLDQEGSLIDYYPQDSSAPQLSTEESRLLQRTLGFGSPERSHVFAAESGHLISFIAALGDENPAAFGALVGRSRLNANPTVGSMFSSLKAAEGIDSGFIVDERGLIAFHPDEAFLLQPGSIGQECSGISGVSEEAQARGRACQDLAAEGTQRLIYYLPIEAMGDWTVVITYPYELVLDRATRISRQLLLIPLAVTGLMAVAVALVTRRLTRRLQLLASAARSIGEQQLDNQVTLAGEDEVGQLGRAFERMRLSLKDRLEDLSLLLRVSETVSSSLDMAQGVPAILAAAIQATDARIARLILLDERGDPREVMQHGESDGQITALDRAMARLGRSSEPVKIENVAEARGLIEPGLAGSDIQALIAVPVRSKDHDIGIMWLGCEEVHRFSATEVDFLSTLAGQAAVAIENARLFQAAEGGRRRLAAILESTSDAVIVTDHANRVLLLNPAAAEVFGADSKATSGVPVTRVVKEEKVIHLLTAPMNDGVSLTDEVPLVDGRTLYASASAIVSGSGQAIGRVAVLRDITYLKELDEMKSEFVATVSHDLRAPLTYVRGYATMIPMGGEVSPLQKKYVEKILVGIEQMTELIDDLLDLGRIEAGVGILSAPFRLDDIIAAFVDSMRPQAQAKGLTLRLNRAEDVTVVIGDASLLRRVISNLLDNAIKYTPDGGTITVGWETRGDRVLISVADSGIGVAKADQVHLFEKFSRIKRRETINIKGSGLGLAIVKSIVEWHGGRVWVDSELGQGSTFYVEIPVGRPDNTKGTTSG